jgi:hypothetical protein
MGMLMPTGNHSTQEAEAGGSPVGDQPGYIARSCIKKTKTNQTKKNQTRAGGMAEVTEHLPSKCEALLSNHGIKKKKKKKKKDQNKKPRQNEAFR